MADGDLEILLIEDNPGDVRLIEEMLPRSGSLLHAVDSEAVESQGDILVSHESRLEDGIEAIARDSPSLVLLDLGLPDSAGLDTLSAVLAATEFVPVVVLTGLADEEVGIEAIQHGAQEYLVKDDVTEDLLVRALYHAIERNRQERERARRRDELEALNRLNRIGQDVTHAVITTDTREALERAVCERLVGTDRYCMAWIGDADRRSDRVIPRVAIDDGDGSSEANRDGLGDTHPAEVALSTYRSHVIRDIDGADDPWRIAALERGYRSIASVPILYEDFLYGVLTIGARNPGAFPAPAVDILERLGVIIAHAISALERKEALLNETVLQLDFNVDGLLEDVVALSSTHGGVVHFEDLVVAERTLVYGHAEGIPPEVLASHLERSDAIDGVRVLVEDASWCKFELQTDAIGSLTDAVTTHGGSIGGASIEGGIFRFTVEFPTGRDKRALIDLIESHCSGAVHQAQRTVERSRDEIAAAQGALNGQLTEKQALALRAAYHAGFFEWPRESSGQDVADRLDIAPATFSQHLRSAEQKVFSTLFESDDRTTPGRQLSPE